MPISATGSERARRRAGDDGYTLIEALVTLTVLGLMAGVVVLSAPGPDRRAREAAEILAARLSHAGEESIIVNKPIAFFVTAKGYGFSELDERGWRIVERRSPLAFRAWPDGAEFRLEGMPAEQLQREDGRAIRFDPVGEATPAHIVLTLSGARFDIVVDGQGRASVARHE
jgi:general secretion pathway protein H